MRKHIYVIANTYVFPSSAGISGGVKHLIELLKRLESHGFSFTVISPKIGRAYLRSFGVKDNFIVTSSISNRWGVFFSFIWSMFKSFGVVVKLTRASIVYSEGDSLANIFPAFIAKVRNRNTTWITAFHLVTPNPFTNLRDELRHKHLLRGTLLFLSQKLSLLLIKSTVDLIFTGDYNTKSFLVRLGIPTDKIMLIKMGVNIHDISAVPESQKIYDACFVGRFHPQKGIFDLIEIWDRVCRFREHSTLVIIGAGDEFIERRVKDNIRNRATLHTNVNMTGFLFGEEYYKVIKSSKMLLFPSKHEGNPIVPLDAMACGVPVIAYQLPVLKEMYARGIITVPIGDVDQFARKILTLLQNTAVLKENSREAFETASLFDWDLTIEELIRRLNEMAGEQK